MQDGSFQSESQVGSEPHLIESDYASGSTSFQTITNPVEDTMQV